MVGASCGYSGNGLLSVAMVTSSVDGIELREDDVDPAAASLNKLPLTPCARSQLSQRRSEISTAADGGLIGRMTAVNA